MICPYCKNKKTYVIDSFFVNGEVQRSRQCDKCNKRFTTIEKIISTPGKVFSPRVPSKNMKCPKNYYTIYDSETDEIVASGNARECAKQLGVREQAIYRYISRHKNKDVGRYTIITDDYNSEVE